jgi:hypothetical protein
VRTSSYLIGWFAQKKNIAVGASIYSLRPATKICYRNNKILINTVSINAVVQERYFIWPIFYHFLSAWLDCVWNVIAHVQKQDLVFRRKERVHLNRQGRQFRRLLAAEACALAVVMLDTPCSEVVWRVLATHTIGQFPLHFPSRASPCAITFQLDSTT